MKTARAAVGGTVATQGRKGKGSRRGEARSAAPIERRGMWPAPSGQSPEESGPAYTSANMV
jgi:hypothetical protein